jgi:hypothetical protein
MGKGVLTAIVSVAEERKRERVRERERRKNKSDWSGLRRDSVLLDAAAADCMLGWVGKI